MMASEMGEIRQGIERQFYALSFLILLSFVVFLACFLVVNQILAKG